jgi:N-acyl-D-amino-acid deacylase
MKPDTVIRNGEIFDGKKLLGKADIAVQGDKISQIGIVKAKGTTEIDASGLLVTPGFIDVHTHATLHNLNNNNAANLIYQGVTSVVTGNCGFFEINSDYSNEVSSKEEIIDLMQAFDKANPAINFATLVGHTSLRKFVLEGTQERPATQEETAKLVELVEQALDMGAIGFSTGLMYNPGSFAKDAEIVSILKKVAEKGKIYTTHMRNEDDQVIESVDEALRHATDAQVKLQISHHKAVGRNNFGKVNTTLEMISNAQNQIDVNTDSYVYNAGSARLDAIMPKEIFQEIKGDFSNITDLTKYVKTMAKKGKQELCENSWEDIIITSHKDKSLVGKTVYEIGNGKNLEETYFNLLKTDSEARAVFDNFVSNKDIETVVKQPYTMIASDGYLLDSKDRNMIHPRNYGNTSKFISTYVNSGILSVEEGLRKLTSLPADTFGFTGRGRISTSSFADIAIMNLENVKNVETMSEPYKLSEGMKYVICNGQTIFNGEITGRNGRFIKR